jgi:hypothetical protein
MVYNDWEFVRSRHRITDRKEQFAMAASVVQAITSAAAR